MRRAQLATLYATTGYGAIDAETSDLAARNLQQDNDLRRAAPTRREK
jgi:hypothetical protein